MKNIYLIATIEESNLYYNHNDKCFQVSESAKNNTPLKENQFIYIIGSEELTTSSDVKNKWFLSEYGFVIEADKIEDGYLQHINGGSNYIHFYKEVLLTNDPILIADGVQEIEQSFLSFYAENPVDYVEVIDLYGSSLSTNMGKSPRYSLAYKPKPKEH